MLYYRVEATPTSRFEDFGRDVGVAPTGYFHSNQLMLNSYANLNKFLFETLIRTFSR
jgi:hypothetical protein